MAVRIERDGVVATVVIDRPDVRNAVDGPTAVALNDAFVALDADESISVIVLWGAGGTFCSGADLAKIGTQDGNRLEPDGPGPMGPTRMLMSKPVIAAVEGFAVAGGLELAAWCDLRVAGETAIFGVFCRRWGVPLVDGGTVRLPRIVGFSRAMDMILTGREVMASEAKQIGLVDRMVPEGSAREEAENLAREIAAFPQLCLRNDRLSAYQSIGIDTRSALADEFAFGMDTIRNSDLTAGASRFFEPDD
ncbi:MAG: crotonase/enoyl-CoA hydratase family protein [Acidimicrobiia bacterium]|nr:MAG: crotonase/enoyl-CoA hydratase family protein [Acidimicrobiia bacterium]